MRKAVAVLALISWVGDSACGQDRGWRSELMGSLDADRLVAAHAIEDFDGDGHAEIVLIGQEGAVQIWHWDATRRALVARSQEPLVLPQPGHSVCALADVVGDARAELIVLSKRGVEAWLLDASGVFAGDPLLLTGTGRIGFRVGQPVFAEFVRDVNGDGKLDLIVPVGAACELWLNRGPANGSEDSGDALVPRFDLIQTIPIELDHSRRIEATILSAELRNRIRVPQLDIVDVNGDGRPDLRVKEGDKRRFFLQGEDGRFADKPITVDISIFRDTTPKASVQLGETLVLGDRQRMQDGDLNGDGIPDYVIAHRRKVWSFLASGAGPQFTRSRTRIVAEDVSAMLLVHLDDDERKDLVILKIAVPTAGALVLGLISSIDIDITALGYPTEADGGFAGQAKWRRVVTLRTPSLLSILSDAEDIVERFADVLSKLRWSAQGDFDGDGAGDLAMIGEDDLSLELWRRPPTAARPERATDRWLRELLFEDPDTIFDIDRILKLASQVFDARTSSLTGDRSPDARASLEERPGRYILGLVAADLDGDGVDEVVLIDDVEAEPGQLRITAWRWRREE